MNQLFFRVKQRQLGSRVSVPDLCGLMTVQSVAGEIDSTQYRKALALIDGFIVAGLLKVQPAKTTTKQSNNEYEERHLEDGQWTEWRRVRMSMSGPLELDGTYRRGVMVDIPDPEGPTVDAEDVAAMLAAWRSEIEADVNPGPLLALWLEQHGHSLREVAEVGEVQGGDSAPSTPDDLVLRSTLTNKVYYIVCKHDGSKRALTDRVVDRWLREIKEGARGEIKVQRAGKEYYSFYLMSKMLRDEGLGCFIAHKDNLAVEVGKKTTAQLGCNSTIHLLNS